MKFPVITLPSESAMISHRFPEMTLLALLAVPPIVLFGDEETIETPARPFPRSRLPVTSVPMKTPSITLPPRL